MMNSNNHTDFGKDDWSEKNASNMFKRIVVPYMFNHSEKTSYPEKFENIRTAFLLDTANNPERPDVVRRHRVRPGPMTNRLSFPHKDGYATYKSIATIKFFIELFNVCKAEGFFEPKLLLNHAVFTPWWPSIFPNNQYKIKDLSIDDGYSTLFHDFIRRLISRSSLDEIKLYAHKTTTPGPPFKFADGTYYEKEDFLIAR